MQHTAISLIDPTAGECIQSVQQMSTMQSARAGQTSNAEDLKQIAVEHVAFDLGLLRVCPHCGNRYRVHGRGLLDTSYRSFAGFDPALPLFRGDVDALLSAVEQSVIRHDTACRRCLQ